MVLWISMAIEAPYDHRRVLLRLPKHLRLQIRWPRAVSFTSQGPHGRVSLLWSLQWCMSMLLQAPTAPSQSWSPVIRTSVTRRRYRQGGTRDQLAPSSTTNLSMKLSAHTVFPPKKLQLICLKIWPRCIYATRRNFIFGCSSHSHHNSRYCVRNIHNHSGYFVRFFPLASYYTCIVCYNISFA